jgi:integral membrane protein
MTTAQPRRSHSPAQILSALRRYQVMAWATGVWLLVLTAEVIYHYLFIPYFGGVRPTWAKYIGVAHGWFYFFYLITALDLSLKARFEPRRTLVTLIAGTVPFLSFVIERRRTREVHHALSTGHTADDVPS